LRLNSLDLVLTEQLQELIVRNKVESREVSTLLVKVLLYLLLDVLHLAVMRRKFIEALLGAMGLDKAFGGHLLHKPVPSFVNAIKLFVLLVALLLDLF